MTFNFYSRFIPDFPEPCQNIQVYNIVLGGLECLLNLFGLVSERER